MEALWPQPSVNNGNLDTGATDPARNVRCLSGVELDDRIRAGRDVWCDLLDDLVSDGGVLPSRDLAGRVVGFFEDAYWRAEDARAEAVRRQMTAQGFRRCHMTGRSMGIR